MTLVEIVAAVTISFLVIGLAAVLMRQIRDGGDRIAADGERMTLEANGERQLRELLAQIERPTDSARGFRGDARGLGSWSWCLTPRGYRRRCEIGIAIDSLRDSSVVTLGTSDGASVAVGRFPGRIELRYLEASDTESVWRPFWRSGATLPAAVAFIGALDTVLYAVGPGRE